MSLWYKPLAYTTPEHRPETPQEEWVKEFVPEEAQPELLKVFENHERLLNQFHVGEPAFVAFGHYLRHETLGDEVSRQERRLKADPQNIALQLRYAATLTDYNALNQKIDDLRLSVPGYGVAYDETENLLIDIDAVLAGAQVADSYSKAVKLLQIYKKEVEYEQAEQQDTPDNTVTVTAEEI